MVAIVSGNSLGLSLTSFTTLGQNGVSGSAALGRNGQQVYVNGANGNLVLQNRDDRLVGQGLDALAVRTYNSQGMFDGQGSNDNWRIGFYRGVSKLTGTLNTTGSTITRTDSDGAQAIYTYQSSTTSYVSAEGAGAYDSLKYDTANNQWNWTDGNTRAVDTYDWIAGVGKLLKQADTSGNSLQFAYTGNRLSVVTDQDGEKLLLDYAGNNLSQIRTLKLDGSTVTRVRYGYDTSNRLTSVIVDLSPEDNSVSDGNTYVTSYTYDGDSARLASILESDGTQASFTYTQLAGTWHIASLTQFVDGVARTTRYDYDMSGAAGLQTHVTDALGQETTVAYDSKGQLIKVSGPSAGGVRQSVSYTYDTSGNVLTQTDGLGNVNTYTYDTNGNQLTATDPLGNQVIWTYGTLNQRLTENYSFSPNQSQSRSGINFRFVYDAANRLRFMLSGENKLTEYRYNGFGQKVSIIEYSGQIYTSSNYAESDFATWVSGTADKTRSTRTDMTYDFRGQVSTATTWRTVSTAGTGVDDGAQIVTRMVYDQAGQLLQTIAASGLVTNYTYDGLGRLLSTTDNAGGSTTTVYDDAGNTTRTTLANGLVNTSVFNQAGELISALQSDGSSVLGESRFWYDADGRLRLTQNPNGSKQAIVYDAAGRKTGEIDATGKLTEYRYDANGNRTQTIDYATRAATGSFMDATLDLGLESNHAALAEALALTIDTMRPIADAQDMKSWNLYDADGQMVWQIDALGYATQTVYDGSGHVYSTNRLATPVDTSVLGDGSAIALKLLGSASAVRISESGSAAGPNDVHTYVAVVSGITSTRTMTGTVSFFAGSVLLGSAAINNNVATFSTNNLPVGHSDITAVYSGDASNVGSNSNALSADIVAAQATAIALTVNLTDPVAGTPVLLTATVTGSNPFGMVAFYSGTTSLGYGVVQDGIATLALPSLPTGQNSLSAVYLGDQANAGSSSAALNELVAVAPSTVVLTSSDTTTNAGVTIVLTATVSGYNPLGTVTFYDEHRQVLGTANVINGVASLTVKNLAAGLAHMVAVYSGDADNASSVSAILDETVAVATSSTTLYADLVTTSFGSVLSLKANISGFIPNGTVSFFDAAEKLLGTAVVVNGWAMLNVANAGTPVGDVRATYAGDANNATSTSQLLTYQRAATSLTTGSMSTVVNMGASTTVRATVNGIAPTGSASLFDAQGNLIRTVDVSGNSINADFSGYLLPLGDNALTLVYCGDAQNVPAILSFTLKVNPAGSTTIATSVNNFIGPSLVTGQSAILSATVTGPTSKVPTGQVVFKDYSTGNVLGTATLVNGHASLTFLPTTTFNYSLTVQYLGDAYTSPVSSNSTTSVNAAPSVPPGNQLSASASTLAQGAPLTLTARVTKSDGSAAPYGTVYFYSGNKLLGSSSSTTGVFTLATSLGSVETATIRSVYLRSSGPYSLDEEAVSNELSIAVTPGTPPSLPAPLPPAQTTLSIDTTVNSVNSTTGDKTVTLTARVAGGTSGKRVSFYNAGHLVGFGIFSSGVATLVLGRLPLGAYAFTAVYEGDSLLAPGESPVQTLQVTASASSTTLDVKPSLNMPNDCYTLTAVVNGKLLTTGIVNFYNGATLLGQASLTSGLASLNVKLPAGAAQVRAEYVGDAASAGSVSATAQLAVYNTTTQIVLTSAAASSAIGAPLVLNAHVDGVDPHGVVSFFDGTTLLGSANLVAGVATLSISNLQLGSRQLTAVYAGDTNNIAATSAALTETVVRADTSVVLTIGRQPSNAAAPVTLTATFADPDATGLVTFMNGQTVLGTATINDGQAVLTLARLPSGVNQLRAAYEGDENHPADLSEMVAVEILRVPTALLFSSDSATPSAYGDPVTLSVRVNGDHPTGVVTFIDSYDNTILGTAEVIDGVAALLLPSALRATVTHTIRAEYAGDANNAGSVSAVLTRNVTKATGPSVVSGPLLPVPAGTPIVLYAKLPSTANGVVGSGTTVYWYDGATQIGLSFVYSDGIAQLTTSSLTPGVHSITIGQPSDGNYGAASVAFNVTVTAAPKATTLSMTPSGSTWYSVPTGQTVTLKATVAGGSAPTGVMTFTAIKSGDPAGVFRTLGTANVVNGVANLVVSAADIGSTSYYVNVSYSGDAGNAPSSLNNGLSLYNSGATRPPETRAAASAALDASILNTEQGNRFVMRATIGAPATGTVSFYDGQNLVGSSVIVNGQAVYSMPVPDGRAGTLRAVYSGDASYAPVTSSAVIITAPRAAAAVSFFPDIGPIIAGVNKSFYYRVTGPYRSGAIEIFCDGVKIGTASTAADGFNNWAWSPVPASMTAGSHTFEMVFTSSGDMAEVARTQFQATVFSPTQTNAVASTGTAIVGAEVTYTVTVKGYTPSGTVSFYENGGTFIGSAKVENGVAVWTTRNPTQGTRQLRAYYSGDNLNAASYDLNMCTVVSQAVATATAWSSEMAMSDAGAVQTVTTVITGVKPTGTVSFFDQYGSLLGTAAVRETELISQGVAVFTLANFVDGQGAVSATYSGDANNASSVASVIAPPSAPATVVVSSSATLPQQGMPVILRATVSGNAPKGVVAFFDPLGKLLGEAPIVDGVAALGVDSLVVGMNTISAVYKGDAGNALGVGKFVQQVIPAQTTTTLSSSRQQAVPGLPLVLTARVAHDGKGYPSGSVTFYSGATIVGQVDLVNGIALLSLSNLPSGNNALSAHYNGDVANASGQSEACMVTIAGQALNSITVTASPSIGLRRGDQVTLTARVAGATGTYPSGLVTFFGSNEVLGTALVVNGVATLVYTLRTATGFNLTAAYSGDVKYASSATPSSISLSVTDNVGAPPPPPITATPSTLTLAATPATVAWGDSVVLTANVSVASGTYPASGAVTFFDQSGNLIASAPVVDGVASVRFGAFTSLSNSVVAVYSGDEFNQPTKKAGAISVTVNTTPLTVIPTLAISTVIIGGQVKVRYVAQINYPGNDADNLINGGIVNFFQGATNIGVATVVNGMAILDRDNSSKEFTSGVITAVFTTASGKATGTSAPVTWSTDIVPPRTVTLTTSATQSVAGASVQLTASIPSGAAGTFSFFDGNVLLGSVTPSNGTGSLVISNLAAGQRQFRAVYSGDPAKPLAMSSSVIVAHTVLNPIPVITGVGVILDAAGVVLSNDDVTFTNKGKFARITVTVTGTTPPTGTVALFDSTMSKRVGVGQLVNGQVVFLVPRSELIFGTTNFKAVYSGDDFNDGGVPTTVSAWLGQYSALDPNADTIALTSRPDPAGVAGSVELLASVTGNNPGGRITFKDVYGNVLGVRSLQAGRASLIVPTPPGGLAGVIAEYSGDPMNTAKNAAYTAPPATPLPATTTLLSTSAGTIGTGAGLVLNARVNASSGTPTGNISFYDGSILLGTVALVNGVASLATTNLTAGFNRLTAVYSGDTGNAASMSATASEQVLAASPVTVALVASAGPVRQGDPVTFTAKVSGTVPTGVVTFLSGKAVLGTAVIANGVATLTIARNGFEVGTMSVVASYAGDGGNPATVSAAVQQTVTAGIKSITIGDSGVDRKTRRYLDRDGNLRATLDAEGGFVEYNYDSAGRLVQTIAYATPVSAANLVTIFALDTSSSLDRYDSFPVSCKPTVNAGDVSTYIYYNNLGQKIAEVNGEGYLTEHVYDAAGRQIQSITYATPARAPVTITSTLAALRPAVNAADQQTSSSWDLRGRLTSQTGADGTVTEYAYNNVDQLIGTTTARNTADARTTLQRFDLQGRVKAELSGVGSALITGSQSSAEVDAIWAANATTYEYDAAGLRISTTDALGHRTVFFHDDEGRLRFTVDATGSVTENQYDALGRLASVTRYATAIPDATLAGFAGGLLSSVLNQDAVGALATARTTLEAQNSVTRTAYDTNGHVVQTIDALGGVNSTVYDAFGAIASTTAPVTVGGAAATTSHTYDRRGLETATLQRNDKIYLPASAQYDPLGRLTRSVDVNGNVTLQSYDRLGRVVQTTDAANGTHKTTYDAFDRRLTSTDALNNVTTYSYNTAQRSMTMTTPENVVSVTQLTRTGQVHSITDGNGNTAVYDYDQDGKLLDTTTPLSSTSNAYDAAGRLVQTTDGEGRQVVYSYDAANRMLSRMVDPSGLNLVTQYQYDAKGQRVRSTDATGAVSVTTYDLKGEVLTQAIDPDGLNLVTRYTYDARGDTLSVMNPNGATTEYVYDDLGRRVAAIVDRAGLNVVQSYAYDNNGNVVASIDGNGNRTRYAYDALDRLVYTVDPVGYTTMNTYDAEGRMTRVTSYNKAINLTTLGASASPTAIAALVVATATLDNVLYHIYSKDGKLAYDVDAQGGVTAYQVDGNGNVVSRRTYATRINMTTWVVGNVPVPVADPTRDVILRTVYDALNRPVYTIDGTGAVSAMVYDDNGKLLERIVYANTIATSTPATAAAVGAALLSAASGARDGHTRYAYDNAGRLAWQVDGLGQVTGYSYDGAGNLVKQVEYANPIAGQDPAAVQASSADRVTLMGYDAAQRLVVQVDQSGKVSRQSYDANGNVTVRTAYANAVARPTADSAADSAEALADQVLASAQGDHVVRSVYDAANREIYRVDGAGAVVEQRFDAAGHVIERIAYAGPIAASTAMTAAAVAGALVPDTGRDNHVRFVYDPDGMLLWSVENGRQLTAYQYNNLGELVRRTVYAKALATEQTDFSVAALTALTAAAGSQDGYAAQVFDSNDKMIWSIDGTGAATQYTYDVAGNQISMTTYAQKITNPASLPLAGVPGGMVDAPQNVRSFRIYDSANRLSWSIDGMGGVTRYIYDGKGQLVEQTSFANRINMATWTIGSVPAVVADATDSVQRTVYDALGRVLFSVDGLGQTTAFTYASNGLVSSKTTYATPIPAATATTAGAISAAIVTDAVHDVQQRFAYDSADRVMLQADSQGKVQRYSYDAFGNVTKVVSYAIVIDAGADLASVQASAADRTSLMAYDADNRLVYQIDEMGQVSQRVYDVQGNVLKSLVYATRIARPAASSEPMDAQTIAGLLVADTVRDRVTLSVFDAFNREIYHVDANGAVTALQYDALGRVVVKTVYATTIAVPDSASAASMAVLVAGIANASRDEQTRYLYDQAGQVLWSVNAQGDATVYSYTAAGKVTTAITYLRCVNAAVQMTVAALTAAVNGAPGSARFDYVYDAANRLAWEIDSSNTVTSYQYDGEGNEVKRVVYATKVVRATFVPGLAPNVVADAVRDNNVRTVYDAIGRPIFMVDRDGFVSALKYDVRNNVIDRISYAEAINTATGMTATAITAALVTVADATRDAHTIRIYNQANRLTWESGNAGQVTSYTYDNDGNLVKKVSYALPVAIGAAPESVVASAGDRVTLTAYDSQHRPVIDVDQIGRVTTFTYDIDGNLLKRMSYANRVARPVADSAPLDGTFATPADDALNDHFVRSVFDVAGRELFRMDQTGAVIATRYDGNAVERTTYATAIPVTTPLNEAAMTAALLLVADATRDSFVRDTFNSNGQMISRADARGGVTRFSYDAHGNQIDIVSPEGYVTRQVFNCSDQLIYTVNSNCAVIGYSYDANGNLVRQVQYANGLSTTAMDPSILAPHADDRINLMAYDENHQLVYAVDGEGTVRQQQFDAAGNMTKLTIYAGKVNVSAADAGGGAKLIASLVTAQPNADRVNYQIFDASNRMVYGVDALGFVQKYTYDVLGNLVAQTMFANSIKSGTGPVFTDYTVAGLDGRVVADPAHDQTERFERNVLGQVTWHQDAMGYIEITTYNNIGQKESFTDKNGGLWTYLYDAAGNLTQETAPAVQGKSDAYQRVVSTVYDALGHLLSRTESGDGDQIQTTFSYDNLGNQIATNFGKLTGYTPGSDTPQLGDTVATSVAYDRYGHVIKTVDAEGNISNSVYDQSGHLRFEIDANGNVTSYVRNAFGEVVTLVRYEGTVQFNQASPFGVDAMIALTSVLDQSKKRVIASLYDHAGRLTEVKLSTAWSLDPEAVVTGNRALNASQTTRYTYDAFGAVIQTSGLTNPIAATWRIDNSYYDQRGKLTATVDAAGYLTSFAYDSAGNQISKTESAVAIAGWTGDRAIAAVAVADLRDRITTTTYDFDNRVVRESLGDGAHLANNDHVHVNQYDAAGNVTLTKAWGPGATDSDAPSRMFYDALGRMTAVIDGTHPVGAGFGLTTYSYNVFGKVVRETQYAQGSLTPSQPVPAASGAEDRTRTVEYDQLGNAIHIVNAAGVSQYVSYNKRGLQIMEWHVGTGLAYAAGAPFAVSSRTYDAVGRMLTDSGSELALQYNSFGEMVRKQQGTQVTTYEFDVAGRMWRSNQGGVDTITMYDVLGRVSSVVNSGGQDFSNLNLNTVSDLSLLTNMSNLRRTDYRYDAGGHVTTKTAPVRGASLRPVTTRVFDRWGNLLSQTDPAGNGFSAPTTSYTYDTQNRVLSENYPQANGTAGGRVRSYVYSFGAQDAMVLRQIVDRESASVTGPSANDALHARWRVTTESYTASGKLLSSVTNGLATERHTYDAFDQMRTDGLQDASLAHYEYDQLGHVVSVTHAAVDVYYVDPNGVPLSLSYRGPQALSERYDYDELGYLANFTNSAGEVTQYQHDVRGNVTWTDTIGSAPTTSTWDANGHKIAATDAFGNQACWTYDSYGRVNTMTGFDGMVTIYAYDFASQLYTASQPGKGQIITYRYDAAGQMTSISDVSSAINGYPAQNKQTTYGYDLAGNRVRETTVVGGMSFQDNTQVFDALHRLVSVSAADSTYGAQQVTYEYDGFGNRSRYTSVAAGKGSDRNQNGYFFFDALNRMTVSGALDAAGSIGTGTTINTFDDAGNLKSTSTGGVTEQYTYDARNRVVRTSVNGGSGYATSYDAAGRVVEEWIMTDAPPTLTSGMALPVAPTAPVAPTPPPEGSTQAAIDLYNTQYQKYLTDRQAYDTAMVDYQANMQDYNDQHSYLAELGLSVASSSNYERHLRGYDAMGHMVMDESFKDDGSIKTFQFNSAFDVAGNVLSYATEAMVSDHMRSDYTNSYRTIASGVVQAGSSGKMHVLSGKLAGKYGALASTTMVYDANGNMIGVNYQTDGTAPTSGTSKKVFIMDAQGNILLSREESFNSPTAEQHEIIANGELQLRYSTNFGGFNGLQSEQQSAFWKAYNKDAFQSLVTPGGDAGPGQGDGSTTGRVVIAQEGDTLTSIALRVYGDASSWFRLADANNMEMGTVLKAGQTILAPEATSDSNKMTFDNGKLIGSTAPNLPSPPPDSNNCVTLVIVAVAVIVAFVVMPYMAQFAVAAANTVGVTAQAIVASNEVLGTLTIATGAATGAVAGLASQGVAIAAGVQDHINWKGVGMGALGGAVAAGLGALSAGGESLLSFTPSAGSAALSGFTQAVAGSIITQGVGVATHMQEKFNWAAVAGAGMGAFVASQFQVDLGTAKGPTLEGFVDGFTRGVASGFASGLTTDLLTPGKQNFAQIAVGAFGNALGSSLADTLGATNAQASEATIGADGMSRANGKTFSESREDDPFAAGGTEGRSISDRANRPGPNLVGNLDYSYMNETFAENHVRLTAENTYMPQVIITGQRMTRDEALASRWAELTTAISDPLAAAHASDQQQYAGMKSGATNPASYIAAHFGGLANDVGYELAGTARGAFRLATSGQSRMDALNNLSQTWDHLPTAFSNAANGFASKPVGEQADSLFKFGLGGLATAGAGKIGGFAIETTGRGMSTTARWLAPKAGGMLENYLARTQAIAFAVEPSVASNNILAREIMNTTPAGTIVESGSGSIYYGAKDALGRPTGISASITEDMIKTGTPANPAIQPPGWAGDGTKFNQARGHLLGSQLGGSGDVAENLVTLQQNWTNSPVMRGYEGQIRAAIEASQTIQYSATPMYNGMNLIPRGVTLIGTGNNGFNLGVTILNPIGF